MAEVNEGSKMDPGFEVTCTETNWLSHVRAFENHMKFAAKFPGIAKVGCDQHA